MCGVSLMVQFVLFTGPNFNIVFYIRPCGMIANLHGPVERKRHDCALLAISNLLQDLRQFVLQCEG